MTSLGSHIYQPHFKQLVITKTPTDGSGWFEGLASTWDVDRDGERFAYGAWTKLARRVAEGRLDAARVLAASHRRPRRHHRSRPDDAGDVRRAAHHGATRPVEPARRVDLRANARRDARRNVNRVRL